MPLLSVDDAKERILKGVRPLGPEIVPLERAFGRVLARDVKATRDQPPFEASAMDGYAVRHGDVVAIPTMLTMIGMSAAGHAYAGRMRPGQAVRIFTGAPLPKDADTVVIQENTRAEGDKVTILEGARKGQNVRRRGLDFHKGDVLLRSGTVLSARDVGLAAAANHPALDVRRRPLVAILATGDELVLPGSEARADQIFASNGYALQGLVQRFGGTARDLGIVGDDLEATMRAIAKAADADILVTTGGASVGMHDLVQEALARSGIELDFWKIAMRPGKPLMFARRRRQRVMGLPGNPVSALVCARIFLTPLLCAHLGVSTDDEPIEAHLTVPLSANDGRQDYVRAKLARKDGAAYEVTPLPKQDSSMQRTYAQAGALIVRAPNAPAAAAGDPVPVLILDF
ncbi:MAG: gephyrin-like molybdotransferase Glp [Hyphomicrobiales bacterium]